MSAPTPEGLDLTTGEGQAAARNFLAQVSLNACGFAAKVLGVPPEHLPVCMVVVEAFDGFHLSIADGLDGDAQERARRYVHLLVDAARQVAEDEGLPPFVVMSAPGGVG